MNANVPILNGFAGRNTEEVIRMLNETIRQLQAEIDFLKKEILAKHEDWKHEGQQAANARAEIEALKKELNDIKQYNMDRNLSE